MKRKTQGICLLTLDTAVCKHQKSNGGQKIKAFAGKSSTRVTDHPVRKLDSPYLKNMVFDRTVEQEEIEAVCSYSDYWKGITNRYWILWGRWDEMNTLGL